MDLTQLPAYIITALLTFVSTFAVMKSRLGAVEKRVDDHDVKIDKISKNQNDFKAEIIQGMHNLDIKITQIHAKVIDN